MRDVWIMVAVILGLLPLLMNFGSGGFGRDALRKSALDTVGELVPQKVPACIQIVVHGAPGFCCLENQAILLSVLAGLVKREELDGPCGSGQVNYSEVCIIP